VSKKANFIIAAALALAGPWTGAQTVYRCGSSYSQQPCAGAVAVDTSDPRTPGDAARAHGVAAADGKRADAMEKARLAQEKNAPKAIVIGPQPTATDAKAPHPTARTGKPEQFTAVAPGKPGARKKPKKKKKST
jgi:hypothetical protein